MIPGNRGFRIKTTGLPRISAADFAFIKPPYIHFRRQYHEYILYYILSGEMFLAEGTKEYHLHENDLLLLEPTKEHKGIRASVCRFFYVHFSWDSVENFLWDNAGSGIWGETAKNLGKDAAYFPKYHTMESVQGIVRVRENIERLVSYFHGMDVFSAQQAACQLQELVYAVSSDYIEAAHNKAYPVSDRAKKVIPALIEYLNGHYAEDISGELLQEQFHYHFDYLNRQFKKRTGKTIFVYLNTVRITRAKQLLETGFYTVEDVAEQTGFRDVFYFSRVFKKYTGMTPGQVKTRRLKKEHGYKNEV